MLSDEISGRIEALAWFMVDLAEELDSQGLIDGDRFSRGLRARGELEDQLEYMRIGRSCLERLADSFDEARRERAVGRIPDSGATPAAAG